MLAPEAGHHLQPPATDEPPAPQAPKRQGRLPLRLVTPMVGR